jgi:ketosteroid isomerase-like protein
MACGLWNAIASGEAQKLRDLLGDKSVWRMYGESPLAGTYVGTDAILDFMAHVGELADDLRSDLIDIYVNDGGAVLHYSIHATRGREVLDIESLFMIRVAGGRIVEGVFAPIDQQRYDRFFSAPSYDSIDTSTGRSLPGEA